jgi:hypothetical protein
MSRYPDGARPDDLGGRDPDESIGERPDPKVGDLVEVHTRQGWIPGRVVALREPTANYSAPSMEIEILAPFPIARVWRRTTGPLWRHCE